MYILLEKIYKEKTNSTIIFINETITLENFSSSVWKVSDFISKILVSPDGFVKMEISVFPNGSHKHYENYVGVYADLLSRRQHCQVSTIQLSILTPKRSQRNEKSFYYYWPEYETTNGLHQFISHQTCRNVSEGLLNGDKLTIFIQVFCTSLSERQSESLINSFPVRSVEMWYDWTVCNLSTYPDVPNIKIYSGQFPSNRELDQFHLQLGPRGIQNSEKGYISLYLCMFDSNKAGLSLLVNYTFIIRNHEADGEVLYHMGPFAAVFETSGNMCWGKSNSVLYEKAIKKSCLTIELSSVYNAY